MVFLRVVTGIRDHFESRVPEWAMGIFISIYGAGLIDPAGGWTVKAAWLGMTSMMSQQWWAVACILIGAFRLVALAVNGTFADTVYSRYSPLVRGLAALASATFWFMVVLSLSAVPSVGSRTYLLPLSLEIWCIFHAWRDDGRQRSRKPGSGVA